MVIPRTERLETARLVLRPYAPSDEESFARLMLVPDVSRYVTTWSRVGTREQAGAFFRARRLRQDMLRGVGDFMAFAVDLDGEVIGDVGLYLLEHVLAELSYVVHLDHRGRGYATEAAAEVIRLAQAHGLDVRAAIHPENSASLRVADRLQVPVRAPGGRVPGLHVHGHAG